MQFFKKGLVVFFVVIFCTGLCVAEEHTQFFRLLANDDPDIRLDAIESLSEDENIESDIINELVNLLNDENYNVQQAAAVALVNIGDAAVPELAEGLKRFSATSYIPLRQSITRVLGQIDTSGSVTALTATLSDPEPQIRRAAALALEQIGPNAVNTSRDLALIILDLTEEAQVRAAAAQALGETGYDDDIAMLALAMGRVERQFQIVWAAQGSLDKLDIDTEVLINTLLKMVDDLQLGYLAENALVHIVDSEDDAMMAINRMISHEDVNMRILIAAQLGNIARNVSTAKAEELIAIIIGSLNDQNQIVREAVVNSLTELDQSFVDLVPELAAIALNLDEQLSTRRAAFNAWEWLVNNDYGYEEHIISVALDINEDAIIRQSALRMIGHFTKLNYQQAVNLISALPTIETKDYWAIAPYILAVAKADQRLVGDLIDLIIDTDNQTTKMFAIRILSAAGNRSSDAQPVMIDIVLNEQEQTLRLAAVRALIEIDNNDDLEDFFIALLKDNNQDINRIARQYFGKGSGQIEFEVPAFPGAQGFGAWTIGGRGGEVYRVTNLNDSGPGSLRDAVDAEGPRIVIFDIAGIIELSSRLDIINPYITIAGQTAPGEGITIAHYETRIETNDVIIRHLRFRSGDRSRQELDTVWVNNAKNVILDHLSTSWGTDETLSISSSDNVTVQWCLITESLRQSVHSKGSHGYGSLIRGEYGSKYSFINNLWAHHMGRMPRPGNYIDYRNDPEGCFVDFRNNVFYNWGGNTSGANNDHDSITKYNFINNYYLPGYNSSGEYAFREYSYYAEAYFAGNYMNEVEPEEPWSLVDVQIGRDVFETKYKQTQPFEAGLVDTVSAPKAYERILDIGGAMPRDHIDARIIQSVIDRSGRHIDSQSEIGGLVEPFKHPRARDTNDDGIPDRWYIQYGFDPVIGLPYDGDYNGSGYTNIEEYLNGTDPEVYIDYTM